MLLIKSLLLNLIFILAAQADPSPVEQLKSFISASATFTADFRQVSIDAAGAPGKTSSGQFYLSRPGKFRWNYLRPYVQQIVSNNGKVWFYDADLAQVTVKNLDDSLGATPALLLTGQVELEQKFTLEAQDREGDLSWLKLLPKDQESGFKYILIGLEKGQLSGMELSDNFGQLTRIYFSNIKTNGKLNNDIFNFSIPQGVDVFEN